MAKKNPRTPLPSNGADTQIKPLPENVVRDLTQNFKLLSDETRLRILLHLAQHGELHVSDLCLRLKQSQPAVSHHLGLLRIATLIESRREGKHIYYSLRPEYFGELLREILASNGEIPRRLKFDRFVLKYDGP